MIDFQIKMFFGMFYCKKIDVFEFQKGLKGD